MLDDRTSTQVVHNMLMVQSATLENERVRKFLQAPVAVGMILLAQAIPSVNIDDLLFDPVTATILASSAYADLDPWSDLKSLQSWVLDQADGLRPLVTHLLGDPRTGWWNQSVDRENQLILTELPFNQLDWDVGPVSDPNWEVYAQRPIGGQVSSTEVNTSRQKPLRSGLQAELSVSGTDWHPVYPLNVTRMKVASDARIFEIAGPEDWHELVRRYGNQASYQGPDQNLWTSSGVDHGLAPAWDHVSLDWDGVHATFFGWITSTFVPVASPTFVTTLWSWHSERTIWLRDVTVGHELLPDQTSTPEYIRGASLRTLAGV